MVNDFIIHAITEKDFNKIEPSQNDLYIVDDEDKADRLVVMSRDLVRLTIKESLSAINNTSLETVTLAQIYDALSSLLNKVS